MRSIRTAGGETIEEGDDAEVWQYLGWTQQKTESAVIRGMREEQEEEEEKEEQQRGEEGRRGTGGDTDGMRGTTDENREGGEAYHTPLRENGADQGNRSE